MSHPNALLTVAGRKLLCTRVVDAGRTVTAAALAAGVSRQTAHKWLRRFAQRGDTGLTDRSSRPARIRPRVSPADIRRIWRRRRQGEGPLAISWNTGLPRSTIYAVLKLGRLGEGVAALPRWIFNYNHRRPHGGIGVHLARGSFGRLAPPP